MKLSITFSHVVRVGLCLFTAAIFFNTGIFAAARSSNTKNQQPLWRPAGKSSLPHLGRRLLTPEKYLVFSLNRSVLNGFLKAMPLEFTGEARSKATVIEIPMPDGSLSRFRVEESPVLAPHLAADFPTWKTFHGYGIDDPTATARFDWTSAGFHGYVLSPRGTVYIDPFQENDRENYIVYYKHEYGESSASPFRCNVDDFASSLKVADLPLAAASVNFTHGAAIRTYRLAIATTGEWARSNTASTDPQVVRTAGLAAMTTSVNRLDGIFRREIAVTLQLVNPSITNDAANIIFDDPATDPYNNTDQEAQLNINQTTIDGRVGTANYDVGHLYGTGGGGVASAPSVCSNQKAEGYSAREGIPGDPFTVDYVAHEIGHQFGGSHTYNNRDMGGACTTRSTQNAFEVASGSTIMSYVGICNIRNLQQYVDTGTPAFHIRSLTQMVENIQDAGNGGSCGTPSGANNIPTVNAGASFTIPRLTPFTLTATGNDADAGDVPNLLYSWEEYDLAPSGSGQLGTPPLTYDVDTDGVLRPLFRAYSPVPSRSRTFPSLNFILNPGNNSPAGSNNPPLIYTGTHPSGLPGATCAPMTECVIGENLPSVARTMNFRVAVRDRRGGSADAGMTVTTVLTPGPFKVTVQDTPVDWPAGSTQTVTWDVVDTNNPPINAANVNILLSLDGGQTFPTTLAADTPNDGTEQITVPATGTDNARIKVAAAGNIFFDINNANFQITGGAPGVAVGDAQAGEGPTGPNAPSGAGTVDFPISLSAPSAQTVTIRVSTNGITASEGGDFIAVDDLEVVFPPNTLTRVVSVPTIEDPGDEPDETFSLDVTDVTNATVADGQGIGTIVDDDAGPTTADLAITKTDGQSTYVPGSTIHYTIIASNSGPGPATDATVTDNLPASITSASFTCSGTAGGTCPASGTGNISAAVNLPAGAAVTFILRATVSANATGNLTNTATITAPPGVTDANTANNSATDVDTLRTTASGVEVSGRVLTPDGRGLRNAQVVMVDASGVARTAMTSSFGYFSFTQVAAGQTYVIGVNSRGYRFASRVIDVTDALTDLSFVGGQ